MICSAPVKSPSVGSMVWHTKRSDSSRIAFTSDRDGDIEVYSMDADGDNVRRLTKSPGDDEYPSWSPDGRQIAFCRLRGGVYDTYVMDANGGNVHPFSRTPLGAVAPVWSSDGQEIAFFSSRWAGLPNIVSIGTDGKNLRNLSNFRGPDQWHLASDQV